MPNDAIPVLDAAQVADLMGLDKGTGEVYGKFVTTFLAGADGRIAQIRSHAEAADMAALSGAAHMLAGSAANLGAARLAALLIRLEGIGKRRDGAAAIELLGLLDLEFALAREALLAAAAGKSARCG